MGNGVRDGEKGGCGFALPTLQKTRPFNRRAGKGGCGFALPTLQKPGR